MTLLVSACGLAIGAALGGLVAWARLSGALSRGAVGQAYAALFRGLPELLIVYFVYFGTSTLLTETRPCCRLSRASSASRPSPPARSRSASFPAPIRRKCFAPPISPSSRGELEAAVSVGMDRALMFRRIIAPQVLRFALPGSRQSVAGGAQGFLADLGHRPHGADAGEPGRRRLDPSALRLLSRRRGALSRDDAGHDPAVRCWRKPARRAACAARRGEDRWSSISSREPSSSCIAALPLTLAVWALSVVLGAFIAAGVTWMRVSGSKPLEMLARGYVAVFRGTPLLIQLFIVYYGLASFPAVRASVFWPFLRDAFDCAVLSLALCTAAYQSRDLPRRAARRAARTGRGGARLRHVEAASCSGASSFRSRCAMRLPAYSTEMISMVKATALVSLVTLVGRDERRAQNPQRYARHLSAAASRRSDLFRGQLTSSAPPSWGSSGAFRRICAPARAEGNERCPPRRLRPRPSSGHAQALRAARSAEGHLADRERRRRDLDPRLVGIGQEHVSALHQSARDAGRGRRHRRRRGHQDAPARATAAPSRRTDGRSIASAPSSAWCFRASISGRT